MTESEEELQSFLMTVKKASEKAGLKLNIKKKKLRSWHLVPSLHGKDRGKSGSSDRFYFFGLQNPKNDCSYEIKSHLLLGRKGMTNLDCIKKHKHHFADKGPHSQSYGFSSYVQM